jgi:hypothetical protein
MSPEEERGEIELPTVLKSNEQKSGLKLTGGSEYAARLVFLAVFLVDCRFKAEVVQPITGLNL